MENCEQCGNPMKFVPAGISKRTGRAYEAFSVCEYCKPKKQYQKSARSENDQGVMILSGLDTINQRIDAMNQRLDKLADFLIEKLNDK